MALQLLNELKSGKFESFNPNGNLTFEEYYKLKQSYVITPSESKQSSKNRSPLYVERPKARLDDHDHNRLRQILAFRKDSNISEKLV